MRNQTQSALLRTLLRIVPHVVYGAVFCTMMICTDLYASEDYKDYYSERAAIHEIVWPWETVVVSYNEIYIRNRVMVITVDMSMFDATDISCKLFGHMMKWLTRTGWIVIIANDGWIPSTKKIIDHETAKKLAEGY